MNCKTLNMTWQLKRSCHDLSNTRPTRPVSLRYGRYQGASPASRLASADWPLRMADALLAP